MTEDQLRSMTDAQIRTRFRHAPAYYLQSKLDKKRDLERCARREAACAKIYRQEPIAEPAAAPADGEPASLDIALPGLEILDAALSASDYLDDSCAETPSEAYADESIDEALEAEGGLQAALDGYGNWPILPDTRPAARHEPEPQAESESESESGFDSDSEPGLEFALGYGLDAEASLDLELDAGPQPDSELGSKSELDLLLEPESDAPSEAQPEVDAQSQPDFERRLKLVLESEPELELVLESDPELERALASEQATDAHADGEAIPDNVTVGDFRPQGPRTVRVVSVVMDRKRPYMVRVVGETTRLAS